MKFLVFCILLSSLAISCVESQQNRSDNTPQGTQSGTTSIEQEIILQLGRKVIWPLVDRFAQNSEALRAEIASSCQTSTALQGENVRTAWRQAMTDYHELASVPLGPLFDRHRSLDLAIYSFPNFRACEVDLNVLKHSQNPSSISLDFRENGLGALEYLIFDESYETSCKGARARAVRDWQTTALDRRRADRCALANTVAQNLSAQAEDLRRVWNPSQGDYTKAWLNQSRRPIEAINALTTSLFQISETKDRRLGIPLGRHPDCSSPEGKCPERAEHRFADTGLEALAARMRGFERAYFGDDGAGIDDLVRRRNQDQINVELRSRIDAIQRQLTEMRASTTLVRHLSSLDPAACADRDRPTDLLCQIHVEVREVSHILRKQVVPLLGLIAPPEGKGDSD